MFQPNFPNGGRTPFASPQRRKGSLDADRDIATRGNLVPAPAALLSPIKSALNLRIGGMTGVARPRPTGARWPASANAGGNQCARAIPVAPTASNVAATATLPVRCSTALPPPCCAVVKHSFISY